MAAVRLPVCDGTVHMFADEGARPPIPIHAGASNPIPEPDQAALARDPVKQ